MVLLCHDELTIENVLHCRSLAQYITHKAHSPRNLRRLLLGTRTGYHSGDSRHWVRPHWLAASGQLGRTRGRLTPGDVSYPCASYHTTSDVAGFCAHYHTRPRYLKRHPTLSIQCGKHLFKKFAPSTSSPSHNRNHHGHKYSNSGYMTLSPCYRAIPPRNHMYTS